MTVSGQVPALDVYDIAFLAGGAPRVLDTALIALVQAGRVRVHAPGQFATVALGRRHPVEAAVLDAVGPAGHRSVDTIFWRLGADGRLLDVADGLQRAGLIHRIPGEPRSHLRTRAGRRVLRRLTAHPPEDVVAPGTDALAVALHGRNGLPNRDLVGADFDAPRTVQPFHRGSRSSNRDEAAADNQQEVRHTHELIHRFGDPLYSVGGGPTAPRLPPSRRHRRS
jgi:hypothetical protein